MFRIVAICFALTTAALPARAQDAGAIEAVITSQLQAFNAHDVGKAWGYASPGIQRFFHTPDNFGSMVENGYPMVWTNRDAKFLELREIEGAPWQKVMVRGPDGGLWILDYKMIETDGGWKIDAVSILPAPDVGA
ncbi:MAG: DUF4864 domain-containing protein [Limimaricola sp.]|uniref:DUF4864 domain-containing protein n=1 Tax=Limimaricola sp. TaxID=2211665 RepID=UPI001DC55A14|nr:DUF4864 domain-containing protein [Limimaricola sp.]MBI1415813.1 DUF4864 domain-containing protein [Limimaricola sp.]